jgi:hypothetical protein
MRRTRVVTALLGLVGALGLLGVLVVPAAQAQTGYPPGPCTAVTGTQDVGNVTVGQRFVLQLAPTCTFTPGAPITVTVNGVDIPGKVAGATGFVLVDVTVVSTTQLSIDDPVLTPAVCGVNTVTARGPSPTAQGGTSTQTATFTLTCPTATTTVAVPTQQGTLSRTGANTLRVVAVALALMVAGATFVVTARRRRTA